MVKYCIVFNVKAHLVGRMASIVDKKFNLDKELLLLNAKKSFTLINIIEINDFHGR